jgi:hypothetical protein
MPKDRCALLLVLLLSSACGGDSPTAPTSTAPPEQVTSRLSNTISGGDPVCTVGPLQFACKVFGPITAREGRLDVKLTWQEKDTWLSLWVYDENRQITGGGDTVSGANSKTISASSNVQPGRYYVYVFWYFGSQITPFDLEITYPR